jgi:hypothetical protein
MAGERHKKRAAILLQPYRLSSPEFDSQRLIIYFSFPLS